jgi:hypothetical protein
VTPKRSAGRKLRHIMVVLLGLEAGLVLLVLPWSVLWDRNWWVLSSEHLRLILSNNFLRGAVSGLGLLTLWVGISFASDLLSADSNHNSPAG